MSTATEARDKALKQVGDNANEDWLKTAYEALIQLAFEKDRITSDDLWERVGKPREPRALGVVMKRAAKVKIIVPTDVYTNSHRAACHARPVRVWESLLWRA